MEPPWTFWVLQDIILCIQEPSKTVYDYYKGGWGGGWGTANTGPVSCTFSIILNGIALIFSIWVYKVAYNSLELVLMYIVATMGYQVFRDISYNHKIQSVLYLPCTGTGARGSITLAPTPAIYFISFPFLALFRLYLTFLCLVFHTIN